MNSTSKTVTVELQGGLGNQLFGWAAGLGLSTEINSALSLDISKLQYRKYELDSFRLDDFVDTTHVVNNMRNKFLKSSANFVESSFRYDERIRRIENSVTLRGYFQSPKYFQSITQLVRSKVVLKKETREYSNLESIIKKDKTLAVHVRRGDYVGLQNYHGLTSVNYFNNAISFARRTTNFDGIVVFSDDIEIAKRVIPSADVFVSSEQLPSPAENLILMSKCSALIGSNSSFSWWAAYLGDDPSAIRIFPRPWFSEKNLDTRDLLLDHWFTLGI